MDKTNRDCVVDTGGIDITRLCAFIYTACTEFCSETGRLLCRKSYRDADRDRTDTPLLPAEPDCAGRRSPDGSHRYAPDAEKPFRQCTCLASAEKRSAGRRHQSGRGESEYRDFYRRHGDKRRAGTLICQGRPHQSLERTGDAQYNRPVRYRYHPATERYDNESRHHLHPSQLDIETGKNQFRPGGVCHADACRLVAPDYLYR